MRTYVAVAAVAAALGGPVVAQTPKPNAPPFVPLHVPFADTEPVLDGLATSAGEWSAATRMPDAFFSGSTARNGSWYARARLDWTAPSVAMPGNVDTYPGTTLFFARDLVGAADAANPLHQFQLASASDWCSLRVPVPGGVAQIWVFAGDNDDDDSDWLPFADGLVTESLVPEGVPPDVINDVGFIVRLDDDPTTDVHWIPGVHPEPGDGVPAPPPPGGDGLPAWSWDDWHHVFGRASFGQSFQQVGLDGDADDAVDHEVYEIAVYRPDLVPEPAPDGAPAAWGQWWDEEHPGGAAPHALGSGEAGTPVKPFDPLKVAVKDPPVARGELWLHVRDPLLPARSPGAPSHDDDRDAIVEQIQVLKFDAPSEASIPLSRVQSFVITAYDGIVDGDTAAGFEQLRLAFKNAKVANKLGVAREDLLEPLTNIAALVFALAAERLLAVDGDGLPLDDKALLKAYKALYKTGRALATASAKGEKANLPAAAMKTRTVFKAIEKAEQRLAEQAPR